MMSMASKSQAELEDERQYRLLGLDEIERQYPRRPRNHSGTLTFFDLCHNLFVPLVEIRNTRGIKVGGRHGPKQKLAPRETRRSIIDHFIARWRKDVGDDIFPAMRLILPDKDKERAMYGLKEKALGKLIVKMIKIDSNSPDAMSILNWKIPGHTYTASLAGDFAARCYEVLAKRPLRTEPGTMAIAEVNEKLDVLSMTQKEDEQRPIMEDFYRRMNSEELKWLIRIILRDMKLGSREKAFFYAWHQDAQNLYNTCSNLRRVCWELSDPTIQLGNEERQVSLMSCFQPQLAQFQTHDFVNMIERLIGKEDDDIFWIEEKLDGERMQLHMMEDVSSPGGRKFAYWSRRAKDYTYLYGASYEDIGALTKYLKDAFDSGVKNIILDGEMVTWDAETNMMLPFGTLKTAALQEQAGAQEESSERPVFVVFDILYLNGKCLTNYTLRDRRRALSSAVKPVKHRLQILEIAEKNSWEDINVMLRQVISEHSEGLVVKNPNSMYRLNERNDDWIKVKPEYMTGFGENLDLIIIGGYYGEGSRGGRLSSFLCGLRVDNAKESEDVSPQLCYSFCKIGGGFNATDYATIRHHTEGKWKVWDLRNPPWDIIQLGGGQKMQYERPDLWIAPEDSVVVEVKAASIHTTIQFRLALTLRFPRFKRLRLDKSWKEALSVKEFVELKKSMEEEEGQRPFKVQKKRITMRGSKKRKITVAGSEFVPHNLLSSTSNLFRGLSFMILTDASTPEKTTKETLADLVKSHGGKIVQSASAAPNVICIGERNVVRVASLIKANQQNIIRPMWIFDCIEQINVDHGKRPFLLPFEGDRHVFYESSTNPIDLSSVDDYGDSYGRDVTALELKDIFSRMRGGGNIDIPGLKSELGIWA